MIEKNSVLPDYRPLELMIDPKITPFECEDFIGIWPNFMPRNICDEIIDYTEQVIQRGSTILSDKDYLTDEESVYNSGKFYGGELNRKDFSFLMSYSNRKLTADVNSCLTSCAKHYIHEFQALRPIDLLSSDIKVQKTPPGGGYHLWHYENAVQSHANRELVWMIYLNDMPEGEGETEFLYQRRRIRPTAGTVLIWPAGYTHTHKGNTVLTQDKYILTGWYIKTK
jgi:hypothetical protein